MRHKPKAEFGKDEKFIKEPGCCRGERPAEDLCGDQYEEQYHAITLVAHELEIALIRNKGEKHLAPVKRRNGDEVEYGIRCGTGNLPSNRIPQRLGFLRSHVEAQGEQLSDGEWIDLNVYVLER